MSFEAAAATCLGIGPPGHPRLLLLSPSGDLGYGIERIVAAIERAWPGAVERVDMLRPEGQDEAVGARAPLGTTSIERRLSFSARAALRGTRLRPDVVVAAHVNLLPVAAVLARAFRARLTLVAHGTEVWTPMPSWRQQLVRRCRHILAPSRYTAHWLAVRAGVPTARATVLAWPLDEAFARRARTFQAPGRQEPRLLTVSRVAREHRFKGHFTIARSMPAILTRRPDARWVVVGDGDDVPALRDYCAELGILAAVAFKGSIADSELVDEYARAAVFVLPSTADANAVPPVGEGFGLVYAEAAAFEVPSIASTAAGGATEFVHHGETGLTVAPNDAGALAEAVVALLDDDPLRRRLGEAARGRVLAHHMPEHFRAAIAQVLL